MKIWLRDSLVAFVILVAPLYFAHRYGGSDWLLAGYTGIAVSVSVIQVWQSRKLSESVYDTLVEKVTTDARENLRRESASSAVNPTPEDADCDRELD